MPYRLVGAISFYDRREVKDLLAYLRLIANPRDDEAFLRAIGVPRRGIGDVALVQLAEQARAWELPLLATAERAEMITGMRPNVRHALADFAKLVNGVRDRVGESVPVVVMEELARVLDYENLLAAEGPEGIERWDNVRELIAGAAEWSEVVGPEEEPGTPLQRFLAEAALLSAVDTSAGREDGVTLMTLHTAKGLEWPLVVLAGMEDGLFPMMRAMESPDGLEEERRLCYVGITRARDVLFMTWARARRRGGELRPGMPSRFLRELPPELVEEQRTSFGAGAFGTFGGSGSSWGSWREEGGRSRSTSGGTSRGSGGARSWQRGTPAASKGVSVSTPAPAPKAPVDENQDAPRYVKGERVRHRRFGSGAILGLSGAGKDLKVSVAFDDPEIGTKQLLVAFAGLERDWE